ncbi:MAG: outer membrane protein transport protein [Gammaproteobacteria bacterium]|nr:outer membrane protein transport protein [Gammaproteobacteria bacterium]
MIGCPSAWAGGLWIQEYGAPAMGRAGAGAEAGVDDASTSLCNPASTSRITVSQFMATGGLIWSQLEFDVDRGSLLNGTKDGGDAGAVAPSVSMFYVRPVNDRWSLGVNFYALTGSALDYDDNWSGRFQATDVELVLAALQPNVSYRMNDWLLVGAGFVIGYSKRELTVAVPNSSTPFAGPDGEATIDGDDVDFGFTLGMLLEPGEHTRLGIVYQSAIEPVYSGDATLIPANLSVGIETELPLASLLRIGVSHQLTDRLTGHLTVGWEDWSTLDAVNLSAESGGAVLERGWDDTYHYATGFSYRVNDTWSFQAGISYDTNPAKKENRTADLPLDRQIRYAISAGYMRPSGLEIAGHLVYADYGSAKIESLGFAGEYTSNDILFASVSFNWKLGRSR